MLIILFNFLMCLGVLLGLVLLCLIANMPMSIIDKRAEKYGVERIENQKKQLQAHIENYIQKKYNNKFFKFFKFHSITVCQIDTMFKYKSSVIGFQYIFSSRDKNFPTSQFKTIEKKIDYIFAKAEKITVKQFKQASIKKCKRKRNF